MPPTYVQGVQLTTAQNYPVALPAFAANVTVGNRIIVMFAHSYAGCAPSVTDSLGNTYTFHGTQLGGGQNPLEVFSAPVTTGGACVVTLHAGCGQTRSMAVALEYSGLASTPYDGEIAAQSTTSAGTSGSLTTTAAGDLLVSLFYDTVITTLTPSGGATQRLVDGTRGDLVQDQIVASAGAVAATATGSGGTNFSSFPINGHAAAFKAAAGGPPTVNASGAATFALVTVAALAVAIAASASATFPLTTSATAAASEQAQATATFPLVTTGTISVVAANTVNASAAATFPLTTAATAGVQVTLAGAATTFPLTASASASIPLRPTVGVTATATFPLSTAGTITARVATAGAATFALASSAGLHVQPIGAHAAALTGTVATRARLTATAGTRARLIGTITTRPGDP